MTVKFDVTLAKQNLFLANHSLNLAHAHNNEIRPTCKSNMEDEFAIRFVVG